MKDLTPIFIIAGGITAAIITFAAIITNNENSQPCEFFKNTGAKDIPGRCINYFNNQ